MNFPFYFTGKDDLRFNQTRNKRQTERQAGESFRASGTLQCRPIRQASCSDTKLLRRHDTTTLLFTRIGRYIASGTEKFLKNFFSPYGLTVASVISTLAVAFVGTYFLPFLP